VRIFRPVWVAFRTAVVATAVFWITIFIVENSGWEAPMGVVQLGVFFVIFFFCMLLLRRQ
jgi:glycerol uptake facilitator-like aquaporin